MLAAVQKFSVSKHFSKIAFENGYSSVKGKLLSETVYSDFNINFFLFLQFLLVPNS